MSTEPQPRPGQATLAGTLIIGGSVVLVLTAWQRISTLHTLEVQEELQRALSEPPFAELDMTVDGLSAAVRVLCMVGAGAATAATILGFQVFKRSASARIALTVLAPLILVGGLATAGFFAPFVVAGIVMLWLQPTRDWYAGRPWLQRFEERRAERLAALRPPPRPDTSGPSGPTGPTGPSGPTAVGPVFGAPQPPRPAGVVRRVRPQALVTACVLTWVGSALVLAGLGLTALVAATQRDDLVAELERQQGDVLESSGLSETDVLVAVYVVLAGLAVWAVAAIVLAVLAFTGHNWARITLVVSSASATLLGLGMALASPVLVVLVLVLAVSTWLLLRPDTAGWYRG